MSEAAGVGEAAPADAPRVQAAGPSEIEAVQAGLDAAQKWASSKYFYDRRGSELFERITTLDEYYPTRTERDLLLNAAAGWVMRHRPRSLVELGAGSAEKTRILLRALMESRDGQGPPVYVPMDVSADFLASSARALEAEFADLVVRPLVADMTHKDFCSGLEVPRPALFALLGSTVGNFTHDGAVAMIATLARCMKPGDAFLLGADLRPGPGKTQEELEAAYNDAEGVTAAFNLNLLSVLNRRFGADFDPSLFSHRAFYNADLHRIEMHLVAKEPLEVSVGDRTFHFAAGETLRTEISCKYDRRAVARMFGEAGLQLTEWVTDARSRYGMALGSPAGPPA